MLILIRSPWRWAPAGGAVINAHLMHVLLCRPIKIEPFSRWVSPPETPNFQTSDVWIQPFSLFPLHLHHHHHYYYCRHSIQVEGTNPTAAAPRARTLTLCLFIRLHYPAIHSNYLSAFSNEIISGHTVVFGRAASPERRHIKAKTGSSRRDCATATRCTAQCFAPTRLPAAERIKRKLQWHTQHRGAEPQSQRQGVRVITLFMAVKWVSSSGLDQIWLEMKRAVGIFSGPVE